MTILVVVMVVVVVVVVVVTITIVVILRLCTLRPQPALISVNALQTRCKRYSLHRSQRHRPAAV
jgi:uncharacterized membrane protein YqiK